MAETITTMLAQPVVLPVAIEVAVDDIDSARLCEIDEGTYRVFLAGPGGAGTEASPYELLAAFKASLNAGLGSPIWDVWLGADGLVRIQQLETVDGTLTWDAPDYHLRNLLGFIGTGMSLGEGQIAVADGPPTHVAYAIARTNDTGWQFAPSTSAAAETEAGVVYLWRSGVDTRSRTFDARFLPKDAATRVSRSAASTPLHAPKARWGALTATLSGLADWSWEDLLETAGGQRCAAALGNFQALAAGTDDAFDEVYLAVETLQRREATAPTVPTLDAYYDVKGVKLLWAAEGSRT